MVGKIPRPSNQPPKIEIGGERTKIGARFGRMAFSARGDPIMFRQCFIVSQAAALALLVLASAPVAAAPGYAPGYFSSQHGGYFPGYYGGQHNFGGYYPGYFSGYPAGNGRTTGYYPSYFGDLHSAPPSIAPAPLTPTAHYYTPPAVESSGGRSVLPEAQALESLDPSQTNGGALITVRVPADAEVWFDGDPTKQRGDVRDYKTPALPVGRLYHSEIRARWKDGGRVVDQTRSVPASANHRTEVDFTRPDPSAK
jgi:uncharacterized protein (TIGR03000 family)